MTTVDLTDNQYQFENLCEKSFVSNLYADTIYSRIRDTRYNINGTVTYVSTACHAFALRMNKTR